MAEEIQEAVQIIRVAYDGLEIAMRIGSDGLEAVKKICEVMKGLLDYDKAMGKTSMRKLLMRGGDLQVLQFDKEDMAYVEKMARKYGVLYSVLPDINPTDNRSEIVFHTEAVPRMNMLLSKLKNGRIASFDEYLRAGDDQQLDKLLSYLKEQGNDKVHTMDDVRVNQTIDGMIEKVGLYAAEKKAISVDQIKENFSINAEQALQLIKQLETMGFLGAASEDGMHQVIMDKDAFMHRLEGYQKLALQMKKNAVSANPSLMDITINKSLILEENDHAIKTRIPGTWGENERCLWIKKKDIMEIHNGKTILTFLDADKDYKLYDRSNRVVRTQNGRELYRHYDKVEAKIRERYEKTTQTAPVKAMVQDVRKR